MAAISARFASSKIPMSDDIKKTKLEDAKKTTAKHTHKLSLKKTTSDLKNYEGTFFICTKCFEIIPKDDWDEEDPVGSPYCSYHMPPRGD
jgi:RNA polymerase-binding transcription factor DksA